MEQRADNRKGSIARNISYNTMITVMKYVFSAVCLMYVSRKLQPAASGEVDFATSTTAYFTMFATLGMPIYAIRCCARCRDDREKLSRVFTELFSLRLLPAGFDIPIFTTSTGAFLVFAILAAAVTAYKNSKDAKAAAAEKARKAAEAKEKAAKAAAAKAAAAAKKAAAAQAEPAKEA